LNQTRIDSLVEQLTTSTSASLATRPADAASRDHGVAREISQELPRAPSLNHAAQPVSKFSAKGWKNLIAKDKDKDKDKSSSIATTSSAGG